MEYSINLNDEKTAKLVFYREKDKLRIDVIDFRNLTEPIKTANHVLFSIYLDTGEAYKVSDIINDIRYAINEDNKE